MNSSPTSDDDSSLSDLTPTIPSEPQPVEPPSDWEHIDLWRAVRSALLALPNYFTSDLVIAGVPASDALLVPVSWIAT